VLYYLSKHARLSGTPHVRLSGNHRSYAGDLWHAMVSCDQGPAVLECP
jgi:hypothetical protein